MARKLFNRKKEPTVVAATTNNNFAEVTEAKIRLFNDYLVERVITNMINNKTHNTREMYKSVDGFIIHVKIKSTVENVTLDYKITKDKDGIKSVQKTSNNIKDFEDVLK